MAELKEYAQPLPLPLTIVQLNRAMDEEIRHWLLGMALKRIRTFCDTYDTDGDGKILAREVERDFAQDSDHRFMIIVGVRNARVEAHLLASVYQYYGRLYVCVPQMDTAGSGITLEQERAAFEFIKAWKKELGACGIRAYAPTPAHVRRLKMLHGFRPKLTTMEWEG